MTTVDDAHKLCDTGGLPESPLSRCVTLEASNRKLLEMIEFLAVRLIERGGDPDYVPLGEKVATDVWQPRWWRIVDQWRGFMPDLLMAVRFYNDQQSPPGQLDDLERYLERLSR